MHVHNLNQILNLHIILKGEELRKLINAPAYIECSSKSQQNVKAVFDAAIRVVLQPPKQKKKKSKAQKACSILWFARSV